ncbi:MAG: hypothetical protein WA364_01410 [Candidatus Nitrosopolaris sp.]
MKETKFIPSNFLEPARKEEVKNERWVKKIETKKVTLRIAETNWDKLSIINTRTAN